MDEYLFDLAVCFITQTVTFHALDWGNCQRVMSDYIRAYPGGCSFGVSLCQPYTVDAHGEHRMDDSHSAVPNFVRAYADCMELVGAASVDKPEKSTSYITVGLCSTSAPVVGLPISIAAFHNHTLIFISN